MKASLFGSLSYYKLRAREHFVQNVFGRRRKSYGVGSIGEIFNQALIVLRAISGWEIKGFPAEPISLKKFREEVIRILKARLEERSIVINISPMILA
jgi:hypothetical protein